MPLTDIQKVRLEVGDTCPDFPILADADYQYFLDKNNSNINRTSVDAAKSILFNLSRYKRERIDVLEIYGSDFFKNYAEALKLYINNPNLTIDLQTTDVYAGGISKSDIQANIANTDNQTVRIDRSLATSPNTYPDPYTDSNPFSTVSGSRTSFGL